MTVATKTTPKEYTQEEKERILREAKEDGREIIYDIYSANDETVRICRENERRNEEGIPLPDDPDEIVPFLKRMIQEHKSRAK